MERLTGLKASVEPYVLKFKERAITSRNSLTEKRTYILRLWHAELPEVVGVGEINLFEGLSAEDSPEFEELLNSAVENPSLFENLKISSVIFGYETALWSLKAKGSIKMFDTPFTRKECSIPINGLVWMGDKRTMLRRMRQKLEAGFRCVKIKIGGINFADELDMLKALRKEYPASVVELRLDANGAFSPENAMQRLWQLSEYDIHSIEQPIKQNLHEDMARICRLSPIPVALDEELIGWHSDEEKMQMLRNIRPHYIVLKPALCGGFQQADRWIATAQALGIRWWATSALESNIGLGAIAQWVSKYNNPMPQGLGTGQLYTNNFPSPLQLHGDCMWFCL